MTVLIRGMEMPSRCYDCGFYCGSDLDESLCAGMGDGIVVRYEDVDSALAIAARPDWCPLVEVPTPHGRLIDGTKLYKWIKAECNPYGKPTIGAEDGKKVLDIINATSTVIEAEEEG